MSKPDEPIAVKIAESISAIPAEQWDACAGNGNPFTTHAFLRTLEDSGTVGADTGWLPRHLMIEDAQGAVAACAPLYLKSHSFGEFVFDWAWADAYERAGGTYYPKLQSAVPFTPVTGPRLMLRPGADSFLRDALAAGMVQIAERLEVSSLHVTFSTETEWRRLGELGFVRRVGRQFHWHNRNFRTFDDFLAALSSRKRKAIRRERREVAESGVSLRVLEGADIRESDWDAFHRFYRRTSNSKWGPTYLNREFFSRLHAAMGERIVLVMAYHGARPVAGALNLRGDDALFGRHWGVAGEFRFLHFETCYYQAIEYALAHGISRVEAGAQGPHKVQRGYLPQETYSAHWIADPAFRQAVERFVDNEARMLREEDAEILANSPYRQDGESSEGDALTGR